MWRNAATRLSAQLKANSDRLERFGADRGGMHVRVIGQAGDGRCLQRNWTLAAEAGFGPSIPGIPVRVLCRKSSPERSYRMPGQERRDDLWCDHALTDVGYSLDWPSDYEQGAEIQAVMSRHGYRRILALRCLSAHDLVHLRQLPNPRSLVLTVGLP